MMVCGVTVLTSLLEKTGGIDLFTTYLARFATHRSVTGLIAQSPETAPLKAAQVFSPFGTLRFHQFARSLDIVLVPGLLRQVHLRHVQVPLRFPPLGLCPPRIGVSTLGLMQRHTGKCNGNQPLKQSSPRRPGLRARLFITANPDRDSSEEQQCQ